MSDGNRNGADALISALADHGVELCFANPGTSELDLVLAIDREPRMRPVSVTHEGVASGAADGYARMTGRPASTLLHLAPGYLNAAANYHNARRAFSPIVSIIGDHAFSHRKFDTPLTADLERIVGAHAVHIRTISSPDDAAEAGAEAVQEAVARGGQSALIMCADAAWGATSATASANRKVTRVHTDDAMIEPAARAIREARRPAALIGGSALGERGLMAAARLAAAGVRILSVGFPARQTRGAGRFAPEKIMYFSEMAIEQLAGVDLLVLVGAPEPVNFFAYPDRPTRGAPGDCLILDLAAPHAKAAESLESLADALGAGKPASARAAPPAEPPRDGPLTMLTLAQMLAKHLPEGAIVSDDGVTASHYAFAATAGAPPHDWMCLTGGALGQGGPVAVGAALAQPGRKVVCLTGDGAFLYSPQCLWTMARERLDIVVIVAVNRSYEILKIELARMKAVNPGRASRGLLSLEEPAIDHASLARGFGVEAIKAETVTALADALRAAFGARGPFLIEAVVS